MEQQPNKEQLIPRLSPTVKAHIAGKAFELTWYTTTIQIYHEPYRDFSHLRVRDESEAGASFMIFGIHLDRQMQDLMDRRFPIHYDPEPQDYVIRAYADNQGANLDSGINRLLDGEGGER